MRKQFSPYSLAIITLLQQLNEHTVTITYRIAVWINTFLPIVGRKSLINNTLFGYMLNILPYWTHAIQQFSNNATKEEQSPDSLNT